MEVLGIVVLLLASIGVSSSTELWYLDYHFGSSNGGQTIGITGTGFAADSFNFGDGNSDLGNKIFFRSEYREYECDVDNVATDENTIVCYTRPMDEGTYYVRLEIDGQTVPETSYCNGNPTSYACTLHIVWWRTPLLTSVSPSASYPGQLMTMHGRLFTDKTQSADFQSSNEIDAIVSRVWVGGQECELYETPDQLYEVQLSLNEETGDYTNWGTLKCKHTGNYVGCQNASFIVDSEFGRSLSWPNVFKVSGQYQLCSFLSFAAIDSVSPSTGSLNGGTLITVTGDYLDDSSLEIRVGGAICEIQSRTDTEVKCVTTKNYASGVEYTDAYPGGRGVLVQVFPATSDRNSINDIDFDTYAAGRSFYSDDTSIQFGTEFAASLEAPVVVRLQGFFVPAVDGTYQFSSTKEGNTDVYVSTDHTRANKALVSGPVSLEAGKMYFYELVHSESSASVSVTFSAYLTETDYNYNQTDMAKAETHTLTMTSPDDSEIQQIQLTDWTVNTAPVSEVFELCVTCAGDSCHGLEEFTVKLDNIATRNLACGYHVTVVQNWLNQLPTLGGDTFTVAKSDNPGSCYCLFTITAGGMRGSLNLEAAAVDATQISVSLTVQTPPQASRSSFTLALNGVPSSHATIGDAVSIQTAVTNAFSVSCPSWLNLLGTAWHVLLFEGSAYGGTYTGTITVEDSYCGFGSLKDPQNIGVEFAFPKNLGTNSKVCFAYKGSADITLQISYSYYGQNQTQISRVYEQKFEDDVTEWTHTCVDANSGIKQHTDDSSAYGYIVTAVNFNIEASDDDMFVDNIFIGDVYLVEGDIAVLRGMRRLPQTDIKLDSVSVEVVDQSTYRVTMAPHECASNLPLLEAAYKDAVTAGTYTATSWGSASIAISRVQAAAKAAGGTFSVALDPNEVRSGIAWNVEPGELEPVIESLTGVRDVTVTREGNCRSYAWTVRFEDPAGDVPALTTTTNYKNADALLTTTTVTNGGLYLDPIPGDWVHPAHTSPQVEAYINNVASRCRGNCDFTLDTAVTPSITGATLDAGTVTVDGSGFSTTLAENTVTVGGVACTVTTGSDANLVCTLGESPAGAQNVLVQVSGVGQSNSFQITIPVAITAISPTSGSAAGGTLITLTGTGFSSSITVQVGADCVNAEFTYTTIKCTTTAHEAGNGAISLNTGAETVTADPAAVTYEFLEATASGSISPTTFSVNGGELTITGSGFGTDASVVSVYIGDSEATISSVTDTEITSTAPASAPGSYTVRVHIHPNGDAALDASEITYVLQTTSISPTASSLLGGIDITIAGSTFPSETVVKVGDNDCVIDESSMTTESITCTLPSCTTQHTITNQGASSVGTGYAWEPSTITVHVGDTVQWSWTPVSGDSGSQFRVFSTQSATSWQYDSSGYDSGTTTSSFSYHFNIPGTYYYGGYAMSAQDIFMRGTVVVKEPEDKQLAVVVTVGDYQAIPVGGSIVTCEVALTPTITSISPNSGTSETPITVTGTGFSATPGETNVFVGDAKCTVESVSETEVTCKVAASEELPVRLYQEVKVNVAGKGFSRSDIPVLTDRYFALLPHVGSVSPSTGSLAGGTILTISGGGLDGTTSVVVAGVSCEILSQSYTTITCRTGASTTRTGNDAIQVFQDSNIQVDVTCTTCSFDYTTDATPTVTEVSPQAISTPGPDTVTITGTGLSGDGATAIVVGDTNCVITGTVTDTQVTCTLTELPVGLHFVTVAVEGKGYALGEFHIESQALLNGVSPAASSTEGGLQITISGNGFVDGETEVTIEDQPCVVTAVTYSSVTCMTPVLSTSGDKTVSVTSMAQAYPDATITYSADNTPIVTEVSPPAGEEGQIITLTVSLIGTATPTVTFGDVECAVTSNGGGSIVCTLGSRYGGSADIKVTIPEYGKAQIQSGVTFSYVFSASEIDIPSGSLGGGQTVTITGNGFSSVTTVTICGQPCAVSGTTSATSISCTVPASTGTVTTTCDVTVSNSVTDIVSLPQAYTYDASLTAVVTSVSPTSGGTGGGTIITINGNGFSAATSVTIAGSNCVIDEGTSTDTSMQCITNSHAGSIEAKIEVHTANGLAQNANGNFEYIDRWSSTFTWGGGPVPQDGDFIIIQENQTVLLDTVTNQLSMLLIQGGKLIFEDGDATVHLKANNILITGGGLLQIGTEETPYLGDARITMYGHLRSQELPIYGAKTLGVREGRLEMHGKPIDNTWTLLRETAAFGATEISLQIPVTWSVGDTIVIASTGLRHSQNENEVRTIAAIDDSETMITLNEPLEHEHRGVTETYTMEDGSSVDVDYRAEVGLLTRNIVFEGSNDDAWHDTIEACPEGFDTGMFTAQTCFQGRHGEEVGSDQYGASIMIHSRIPNTNPSEGLAFARIEYVELTYVGQAFRLGRYPIHWHLMGNMTGNYVKGCALHKTFNRAVTIHGTHNLLVERNVIYDIMGGAFFIEDGIETGNVIQYNLAVYVRQSTSLLNDDITPAAYWVTNPNNIIQHNHAAGGTHFGYWYRMHEHPDGPSFDPNICQQNVELGIFQNNTAHSQGWFGLWIFQTYLPKEGGVCNGNIPSAAKFYSLTAWHCEKGAEWVDGGAIQFIDFVLSTNEICGIDIKLIFDTDWDKESRGALIQNNVIIGHANFWDTSSDLSTIESDSGIVLPFAPGLWMDGIKFININQAGHSALFVTHISGTCTSLCGGFYYFVERIEFKETPIRIIWRWEHEGIIQDLDGSFTGGASDTKVVPYSGLYVDGQDCVASVDTRFGYGAGIQSVICAPSVRFHRFAFNHISPTSLEFKDAIFTNMYGNSSVPWAKKRITHKGGWMCILRGDLEYDWYFLNGEQFTNISYSGTFYDFMEGDYLIMKQTMYQKPDRISLGGILETVGNTTDLSVNSPHLAWHYDMDNFKFSYKIGGATSSRKKRASIGILSTLYSNYNVFPNIYRCQYAECVTPETTGSLPDVNTIPDNAIYVENFTSQNCFNVEGDNDDNRVVTIPADCWIVWKIPIGVVNKLHVIGDLFFDSTIDSISLTATYIIVDGRFIAGWSVNDFHTKPLTITLRGQHGTEEIVASNGVVLGAKVLACHGVCDLHGRTVGPTGSSWTTLSATADAGSSQLQLTSAVSWVVGDQIVIAPSRWDAWETEKRTISVVSDDGLTLTLTEPLTYLHIGESHTFGGSSFETASEVGLLTKNIKIQGEEYDKMQEQSFGARVIVTTTTEYSAKGRFSNVEFYHTGQEGYYDSWDPRHSLTFINSGFKSEVFDCAFHDGFSPAIGTYGTDMTNITGNVIHHTVHDGIVITGSAHNLIQNLVVLNIFPGSYQNRYESANYDYNAAINVEESSHLTMSGNAVAGAERVGYKIAGLPCSYISQAKWSENIAHSVLIGVYQLKKDLGGCGVIQGFTVWRARDYGIYHQTTDSVTVEFCSVIDATVGYLPLVAGPPALSHEAVDKYVKVQQCTFIGRSDQSDCAPDTKESTDENLILRRVAGVNKKAKSTPSGGRSGIMLGQFMSAYNGALFKSLDQQMSYPALYGLFDFTGVTFVNFGTTCGVTDRVLYTSPANEDAFHPTHLSAISLVNVESNSLLLIDRPNPKKINPSDCVDMMCDAKLKVLIKDLDGSFSGSTGSIFSEAEYGWDGDASLGVGDYRIPKPLLTDANGGRLLAADIVPNKGIARNDACQMNSDWQAYRCSGENAMDYLMLVIENLDSDTETRRLSPVAIKYNDYIDLNNGPQDHGWCGGYTCQKRISTFYTIVPKGQHIDLYFTGTPPQSMKFHLINGEPTDQIVIGVWIPNPQKLDVKNGLGNYVEPNNAYNDANGKMNLERPPDSNPDQFKPNPATATPGDNYLDYDTQILYVCIGGANATATIETKPTIIVSFGFPAVSVDEFFEDRLVEYLAALLSIPQSKIRYVNVVRETSSRKRRTGTTTLTVAVDGTDANEANGLSDTIESDFQTGSTVVNGVPASTLSTSRALTPETIAETDTQLQSTGVVNNQREIVQPAKIQLVTEPAGTEKSVLSTAPKIHILDNNDALVINTASSYTVTVALISTGSSDPSATLSGTATLSFTDGVAEFTDLTISHSGTYQLSFTPTNLPTPVTSSEFVLSERTVSAQITRIEENGLPTMGDELKFQLQLTDGSNNNLQDVPFKGYTYKIDVTFDNGSYGSAALAGTTTFDFDTNGQLSMTGLSLTGTTDYNVYNLKFRLYTSPASNYDMTVGTEKVQIYPSNSSDYTHQDASNQKDITLKFTDDYSTIIGSDKEKYETGFYNELIAKYPTVYMSPFAASSASDGKLQFDTIVTSKSADDVTSFLDDVKTNGNIQYGRTSITLQSTCGITVNSVCIEEATETTTTSTNSTAVPVDNSMTTYIVFGALGGCVFLALCILTVTYIVKRHQGAKIGAMRCMDASPMSQRPLGSPYDNFNSGTWRSESPESLEPYRMTPITNA